MQANTVSKLDKIEYGS